MSDLFRYIEISLYALTNFLPYFALMVYVFYHRPRFSRIPTTILCILVIIIQILTRFWGAYGSDGNSIDIIWIRLILYTILSCIIIEEHFGKILFMELIFSNLSTLIMIIATCTDSLIFNGQNHLLYCWHKSLIMAGLHLIITLPFSFMIKHYIRPALEKESVSKEWHYYWLIPAIFYAIWQYQVYGNDAGMTAAVTDPSNIVFLIIINAGSILIYALIIMLSNQLNINLKLEQQNHFMDIERLEHQILEEGINDARRARHDLRHHMIIMEDYLNAGDYDKLKEYIADYKGSISNSHTFHFCTHRTMNSLFLHFAHEAKDNNIDFVTQLRLTDPVTIPDIDISVLLGNLLENAVEACLEQTSGKKKIIVRGSCENNMLLFTIDNTCTNEIKQNKKGQFLSTKQKGLGLGIESAKHIVERYDGVFHAEKKENMFYVSFMLKL